MTWLCSVKFYLQTLAAVWHSAAHSDILKMDTRRKGVELLVQGVILFALFAQAWTTRSGVFLGDMRSSKYMDCAKVQWFTEKKYTYNRVRQRIVPLSSSLVLSSHAQVDADCSLDYFSILHKSRVVQSFKFKAMSGSCLFIYFAVIQCHTKESCFVLITTCIPVLGQRKFTIRL